MKKDTILEKTELSNGQFFDNSTEGFLTKIMLAEKLKYSVSFINKLMKQSKIPFYKNGKSVRFILSKVMAALEKESSV